RDRMLGIMQRTYNRTLIPDGLGDEMALAYNKTGDIGSALGDIALVDAANGKRYAIAVLITRPFNDGRASELIRRISGRVHQEMNQPISPTGSGAFPTAETSPTEEGVPDSFPSTPVDPSIGAPADSDSEVTPGLEHSTEEVPLPTN
ncbi:serine hydrolase, partial [Oscillatoria sp. CS-180]|uniref:serine hydrolase n=1 Tax=Oscillatoria sp. CS-180 TaxID=3021720 RepID=UPI00232E9290